MPQTVTAAIGQSVTYSATVSFGPLTPPYTGTGTVIYRLYLYVIAALGTQSGSTPNGIPASTSSSYVIVYEGTASNFTLTNLPPNSWIMTELSCAVNTTILSEFTPFVILAAGAVPRTPYSPPLAPAWLPPTDLTATSLTLQWVTAASTYTTCGGDLCSNVNYFITFAVGPLSSLNQSSFQLIWSTVGHWLTTTLEYTCKLHGGITYLHSCRRRFIRLGSMQSMSPLVPRSLVLDRITLITLRCLPLH